jgi:hypothetical protein
MMASLCLLCVRNLSIGVIADSARRFTRSSLFGQRWVVEEAAQSKMGYRTEWREGKGGKVGSIKATIGVAVASLGFKRHGDFTSPHLFFTTEDTENTELFILSMSSFFIVILNTVISP